MEILRYFGKDINILEVFQAYKQIYIKHLNVLLSEKKMQSNSQQTTIQEDKNMKNIKSLINKFNDSSKSYKIVKVIMDEKEL